jgi:hypothetical protein
MNKFTLVVVSSLLAACSSMTPHYDTKFGDAVREAKLKMIINPDVGKNPDQVAGMDGKAARETILLYQQTYTAPPPAVNVINIGGSLGSGGGGGGGN